MWQALTVVRCRDGIEHGALRPELCSGVDLVNISSSEEVFGSAAARGVLGYEL